MRRRFLVLCHSKAPLEEKGRECELVEQETELKWVSSAVKIILFALSCWAFLRIRIASDVFWTSLMCTHAELIKVRMVVIS